MKKVKKFNVGDKVFAKVKGYPAWPAQIVKVVGKKYNVLFYGTNETGSLKPEDIFYYLKHKEKFAKNPKRKDYKDAVDQIEVDIEAAGTDGDNESNTTDVTTDLDDTQEEVKKGGNKRKRSSISVEGKNEKMIKLDPEVHTKDDDVAKENTNSVLDNKEVDQSSDNVENKEVDQSSDNVEKVEVDQSSDNVEKVEQEKEAKEEKVEEHIEKEQKVEKEEEELIEEIKEEESVEKEPIVNNEEKLDVNAKTTLENVEVNEDKENLDDENKENIEKAIPKVEEDAMDEDETVKNEISDENIVNNIDNNNDKENSEVKDVINDSAKKTYEQININDSNIQLIPEFYFNALKKYAERIKKKEDIFKDQKPDPESIEDVYGDKINILPVKISADKFVGIKYNPRPLINYESEFDRGIGDGKHAEEILELQEKLSKNEHVDSELILEIQPCDDKEIENKMNLNVLKYKQDKLEWLKNDTELYRCTMVIKTVLGLEKAFPKEAIKHLKIMADLQVDQLTLLKHPQFFDMTKRLLKYVGNVESWNYNGEELVTFEDDAKMIRELAKQLFDKFKALFPYKDDEKFVEKFEKESQDLKVQTKELDKSQFFAMSARPNTRKFLMENIYELLDSAEEIKLPFNEDDT
ncbi:PREDICTED: PC4 and SFRS1-interacting protein [Nicrophorus vespilloides]|uniref:PC4 and SFRS1-interacting protein n=1 Tax=Nicrophorus vespilloides TaxID=110193 RepID=A0ABM1N4Z9_NICVS|nr:PREDICTED: PC4 and SFRS1-interacting protein [Nicrophorus vespilloides]